MTENWIHNHQMPGISLRNAPCFILTSHFIRPPASVCPSFTLFLPKGHLVSSGFIYSRPFVLLQSTACRWVCSCYNALCHSNRHKRLVVMVTSCVNNKKKNCECVHDICLKKKKFSCSFSVFLQGAKLPMSIIIVGVGQAEFDGMLTLTF